jgi:hypothetical protein
MIYFLKSMTQEVQSEKHRESIRQSQVESASDRNCIRKPLTKKLVLRRMTQIMYPAGVVSVVVQPYGNTHKSRSSRRRIHPSKDGDKQKVRWSPSCHGGPSEGSGEKLDEPTILVSAIIDIP